MNCRRWAGDNTAFPMADPADDLLEVVVLQEAKLLHLLRFWALLMMPGGRPLDIDGVRLLQLRDVSVTSTVTPPPDVHINGDPAGRLPIHVRPGQSIRVRVDSG